SRPPLPLHSFPTRRSSDLPFCRPNPRTSLTVMPMMPAPVSASFTSSSLNGLMIASIFFMPYPQRERSAAIDDIEGGLTADAPIRSEEHTSELQSRFDLVCR